MGLVQFCKLNYMFEMSGSGHELAKYLIQTLVILHKQLKIFS